MEIGSIIKTARNEAGLSQEQAAEALGVSRQTVSNWETGKTYPDIISVIKMSDLYSVSLDRLLKEESSVKQSYRSFLEESTNTVKSNERKSILALVLTTLGIWALSLLAFILIHTGVDRYGYGAAITWTILPITFFVASFLIGSRNFWGRAQVALCAGIQPDVLPVRLCHLRCHQPQRGPVRDLAGLCEAAYWPWHLPGGACHRDAGPVPEE